MARSDALLCALVVVAACRSSPPPQGAPSGPHDAGLTPQAVPFRQTMWKRVRCAIPDGGARVSAFDAHLVSPADCERWPLSCGTPAARAEVLRRFDAGTLEYPTPHHTTRTDAHGWFEVSLEPQGVVVVECADETVFHAPSGFDQSFTDPTIELSAEPPPHAETGAQVLVINPWTRRTAVVDGASFAKQPQALIGHAWATTLEGKVLVKAPSEWGLHESGGAIFGRPSTPPSPPANAVKVRVRVEAGEGLPLRAVQLQLRGEDGGLSGWVETRTAGHDFEVEPGRYTAQVRMPGAAPVAVSVDQPPNVVRVTLAPGVATLGNVVDAAGQPVSGASVEVDDVVAVTTDATGAFTLESDGPHRLRARHAGVGVSDEVAVTSAGPVRLVLQALSDTRVRLEAPDGGVVNGLARVAAGPAVDLARTVSGSTVVVRNSELSLAGLAKGHHELLVLTRDWRAAQVSIDVGDEPVRVVRRLEEKPEIDGVVVRAGKPVVGAKVRFARPDAIFGYLEDETVTDERGQFRLGRSLPGDATLRVESVTVKRAVPATGQRLDLGR